LGVILLRFLVNLYDLEVSTEDTGEDKFGLVLHAGLLEHGDKLFVLSVVETKITASGACAGPPAPYALRRYGFLFHLS